jgi:hypothetical protein
MRTARVAGATTTVAVIVPTLNEAGRLPEPVLGGFTGEPRQSAIAAIFDLDGTLYAGHIVHGIARHHRVHRVKRTRFYFYMATHLALWPLWRCGLLPETAFRGCGPAILAGLSVGGRGETRPPHSTGLLSTTFCPWCGPK